MADGKCYRICKIGDLLNGYLQFAVNFESYQTDIISVVVQHCQASIYLQWWVCQEITVSVINEQFAGFLIMPPWYWQPKVSEDFIILLMYIYHNLYSAQQKGGHHPISVPMPNWPSLKCFHYLEQFLFDHILYIFQLLTCNQVFSDVQFMCTWPIPIYLF